MSDEKKIATGVAAADDFLKKISQKTVQNNDGTEQTPATESQTKKPEGLGPRKFEF